VTRFIAYLSAKTVGTKAHKTIVFKVFFAGGIFCRKPKSAGENPAETAARPLRWKRMPPDFQTLAVLI
jgi:hypothetical protein